MSPKEKETKAENSVKQFKKKMATHAIVVGMALFAYQSCYVEPMLRGIDKERTKQEELLREAQADSSPACQKALKECVQLRKCK